MKEVTGWIVAWLFGLIVGTFLFAHAIQESSADVVEKSMICNWKGKAYHMVEVKP